MFITIIILNIGIYYLNKKGIAVGIYRKNIPLRFFVAMVLLGIFMRLTFWIEFEYLLKDIVEPILCILIIYIIMSLLNRYDFVDKLKIHDFVGALLIVGGIGIYIIILCL